MESESKAGSPSSMDSDMEPVGLEERVVETPSLDMPVGDPPGSNMQIEEVSVPHSVTAIDAGQASHVTPPLVDSRSAQPRTYLDSVVGRGTDAAPFLIDNAAWFTHKGLVEVIKSSWDKTHLFTVNVPRLTAALGSWNKSTFGNINHRKRITMARIEGFPEADSSVDCEVCFLSPSSVLHWMARSNEEQCTESAQISFPSTSVGALSDISEVARTSSLVGVSNTASCISSLTTFSPAAEWPKFVEDSASLFSTSDLIDSVTLLDDLIVDGLES
nr:uncharacterized protein LOC109168902 [Ipomoea trifida]